MSNSIIPRTKYLNDILKFKDKNLIKVITGQEEQEKAACCSYFRMILRNQIKMQI